tara:strand:- start:298 stop:717 length:420 start_codon:yes stop_codon:yes gene_type:complete
MKKINRHQLRNLINESMDILSRDDGHVEAFIDKIEKISTGSAHPSTVNDTMYNMNPSSSLGHFLLAYIQKLPAMAEQYPLYRERANRFKQALSGLAFALHDRHGTLADKKTSTNTPYVMDFIGKALTILNSINYNPTYN